MLYAGMRGLAHEETMREVRGFGHSSAGEMPDSSFSYLIGAISKAADRKGIVRA